MVVVVVHAMLVVRISTVRAATQVADVVPAMTHVSRAAPVVAEMTVSYSKPKDEGPSVTVYCDWVSFEGKGKS